MPETNQAIFERLNKEGRFDEADVNYIASNLGKIAAMGQPTHIGATIRTNLEVISAILRLNESIKDFDQASGKMVERGNKINTWVLIFAIIAAVLAGASVVFSWLAYQFPKGAAVMFAG